MDSCCIELIVCYVLLDWENEYGTPKRSLSFVACSPGKQYLLQKADTAASGVLQVKDVEELNYPSIVLLTSECAH